MADISEHRTETASTDKGETVTTESTEPAPRPMRMLDLFSGTGSVGRVFARHGYDVTTLDLERRFRPDIVADVLEWDYKGAYDPGHFDVISLGVPCTEFSAALTTRPRDLELANRIVRRALEIVEYLQPKRWFLENPRTGLLKNQDYMQGFAYVDIDYCQFTVPERDEQGLWTWGYRKPTRFWVRTSFSVCFKPSNHQKEVRPRQ